MEQLIIVGAGPAGVSAALYAIRLGVTPLVIHNGIGALKKASIIENYYGLPAPISGEKLYETGLSQLKALNIPVAEEELLSIAYDNGVYQVQTSFHSYESQAIILATGAKRNPITLKEAKKYEGNGISYCAVCDGFFFRNKNVGILGNGDYALHEAKVLEPLAKAVTIFTNGLTETFDSSVLGNIQVNHKKLLSVGGENSLEWITFEDGSKLNIDGLFVALGTAGSTDIAKKLGLILKDNHIMIETDTSTMLPGFFAAGDCTGGMMQIAKAVYEGAQAGTKAVKFIKNTK